MADESTGPRSRAGESPSSSDRDPHAERAESVTDIPVSVRVGRLVGKDVDAYVALDKVDHERTAGAERSPHVLANRIGRYHLHGEVGHGGQGAILRVYDQDLRRHLAMKVVRGEGPDKGSSAPLSSVAPKVLGRFLEEAQVTAQLDHPGIVPVHELGLDAEQRVYFTMKYVKGEDLAAVYCKTKSGEDGWNRTRALNVLVKVCEAMSYAHHKGVIHRDLKPGNVMVGRFGEVYVMDWGLARVLSREDAKDVRIRRPRRDESSFELRPRDAVEDEALMTMDGDVVGTPSYMPPEQALGSIAAMGPHSDVYSLGAMLYELLAGHPPYVQPGRKPNILEILLSVQKEPPQPLAREAPDAPQELVAICEKAMAREPAKRYPDMSGMAEDLRAFLEGRVVQAYETGAVAELRKWVRRNRALAGAMAAGVLALIAGLATTLVQKSRADHNAALALEREGIALRAEEKATAEAERANREAETARRTAGFLVGLFEVVDPGEARGNTITAREILDRGAQRIETELMDEPEVQSALMETMGTVYRSLGLYTAAVPLLQQSLARREEVYGPDHPLVGDTLNSLGELRRKKAEYGEAERVLRRALELRKARLGPENEPVAESMHQLGVVLTETGRFAEAEPLFRESLAMRRKVLGRHPAVAESLSALAFNLFDQGDRDAAQPLLAESLEIREAFLGEHPDTAESLNDMGVFLFERQDFGPAEKLLKKALEMKRRIYTDVHPEVALGLNNLAVSYHERGLLDEAETLYLEALAIQRQLLEGSHPDIAQAMQNVAMLRKDKGDWEGAREFFLGSLAMYRSIQGDEHPSSQGALQNAILFLRDLVSARRTELGERSPGHALALVDLADLLVLAGKHEEGLDTSMEALDVLREGLSDDSPEVARAESVLGAALIGLLQYEDAEGVLLRSYEVLRAARGPGSAETQAAIRSLVRLYELQGRPEADEFRALLSPEEAARK
jgi:serine/threonine protein kinase/Flp pilus assembly protein TadD